MTKLPKNSFETKRLLLIPYEMKYYKDVFALINNNKDRLIHSFPNMLRSTENEANTKDYVQQKIFDWNNNKAFAFMVFLKDNKMLIGHINIKDIDWRKRHAELAYLIDEKEERKGFTTEALQTILKIGFTKLSLKRIFARIVTTNIASQKVIGKAGLKFEGSFNNVYTTYDSKIVDTYCFGISKEEYYLTLFPTNTIDDYKST